MLIDNLFNFFKKINYSRFLPIFLFPFLLICTSISGFAADNSPVIDNSWIVTWYGSAVPSLRLADYNNNNFYDGACDSLNAYNEYQAHNPAVEDVRYLRLYNNSYEFFYQYVPEVYDYWISFTCFGMIDPVPEDFSYVPDIMQIFARNCDNSGSFIYSSLTNLTVYHHDDLNDIGFTAVGKVPDNLTSSSALGFRLVDNSTGTLPADLRFMVFMYAIPKSYSNSSDESTQAIIAAINSQTSSLKNSINSQTSVIGGKIDDTNDVLENGNSSTSNIVSGANTSKNELDSIVSDYQQIENNMLDNFTLFQTDILSDIQGWSWGGLSVCANWVGDTMTSYFQNMGDFKQYIIYPLLLGIALFFIGRGSSIIGHLYRKPTETYTISESSTSVKYVNGQRISSSVTKTNKDGGVLRK